MSVEDNMSASVEARIRQVFADAGVRGWLHAVPVDRVPVDRVPVDVVPVDGVATAEVAVDPDVSVPLASVWKLPLLVAYARAVDAGTLDPTARTTLSPENRTGGGAGISLLQDPITVSWRDLVTSMIAMSDNAAADAVHRKVGSRRIQDAMADLGLRRTRVRGDSRSELQAVLTSTGATTADEAFGLLADADRPTDAGAYSVLVASSSTPREISTLLAAIWTNTAASAEQCAFAREVLHRRVGPYRLRLGFPLDSIAVAEKSGTVGALRHSAGVIRFPGEAAYAVSVFTRAARADRTLPSAEAAIGAAAKIAVDGLRMRARGREPAQGGRPSRRRRANVAP